MMARNAPVKQECNEGARADRAGRDLRELVSTVSMVFDGAPPNFRAEIIATVGGFILPEIVIPIIFAIIAFFTAGIGAAALAGRLMVFVSNLSKKLKGLDDNAK